MDFVDAFNKMLILPVRYVDKGEEIKRILGVKWDKGKEQLKCVLSKNYLDDQKRPYYNEEAIRKYLKNYAYPLLRKEITKCINEVKSQ